MVTLRYVLTDEHMFKWAMDLLEVSFPPEERRDYAFQRKVMSHPHYRLATVMEGDQPVGVVGYFDAPNFVYLENFCIAPSLRNRGYGSQTLRLFTAGQSKPFILEAELPTDDVTRRRIAFYKRNGMVANPYRHVQAHYRKGDADLPLLVLTFKQPLTVAQYAEFRRYLDDNVEAR